MSTAQRSQTESLTPSLRRFLRSTRFVILQEGTPSWILRPQEGKMFSVPEFAMTTWANDIMGSFLNTNKT